MKLQHKVLKRPFESYLQICVDDHADFPSVVGSISFHSFEDLKEILDYVRGIRIDEGSSGQAGQD